MKTTLKNIVGNSVICTDEKGSHVCIISIGDVVEVPFTDPRGQEAFRLVKVTHISNGEDAGDFGDIGYYFHHDEFGPGQDICDPDKVLGIYRQAKQ